MHMGLKKCSLFTNLIHCSIYFSKKNKLTVLCQIPLQTWRCFRLLDLKKGQNCLVGDHVLKKYGIISLETKKVIAANLRSYAGQSTCASTESSCWLRKCFTNEIMYFRNEVRSWAECFLALPALWDVLSFFIFCLANKEQKQKNTSRAGKEIHFSISAINLQWKLVSWFFKKRSHFVFRPKWLYQEWH